MPVRKPCEVEMASVSLQASDAELTKLSRTINGRLEDPGMWFTMFTLMDDDSSGRVSFHEFTGPTALALPHTHRVAHSAASHTPSFRRIALGTR